jgi:hypothetical protein
MNVSSDREIEVGNFAPRRLVLWPPGSICIVDWNINRGLRLNGILDFLAGVRADLILLQESDLNAKRTHRLNIAREIAQKLEMNYVFGREFQELTQGSDRSPAYHGQVTLSRWPLSNPRIIRFERQSTFWRPRWFLPDIEPLQERIGGRMALVTETTVGGRMLVSYNLHLESRGDDRLRCSQLEECLKDSLRYKSGMPIVRAISIWTCPALALTRPLARRCSRMHFRSCQTGPHRHIRFSIGGGPSIGYFCEDQSKPTVPVSTLRSRRRIIIRFRFNWLLCECRIVASDRCLPLGTCSSVDNQWRIQSIRAEG